MGASFSKVRKTVKKLDPEVVALALDGILIGIVSYKPEYTDQLLATFEVLKGVLSDEQITEDAFHNEIQKTLEDIGVDDPQAQLAIKLFLTKLDRLAEKYLDVEEGFTEEEKQAWKQVFDELILTLKLFKSQHPAPPGGSGQSE